MAVNQFNTIPEANLPDLAAGKTIAHIRAIDADGTSTSVTPAQAAAALAPSLGIDYSILTEQIVPGEFWLCADGSRRQVYVRTFQGSASPSSFDYTGTTKPYPYVFGFPISVKVFEIVRCSFGIANSGKEGVNFNEELGFIPFNGWSGVWLMFKNSVDPKYNGVPYSVTFKYVEL